MAHRSVGHPAGLAIILKVKRRRHLGGPFIRCRYELAGHDIGGWLTPDENFKACAPSPSSQDYAVRSSSASTPACTSLVEFRGRWRHLCLRKIHNRPKYERHISW